MNNEWVHNYLNSMYPNISDNCNEPIVMDEHPYSEHQFTMTSNGDGTLNLEKTVVDNSYWDYDGISLTGNPGYQSPDTITFTSMTEPDKIDFNLDATSKNGFWKYEEDKTLKEVRDYLAGTYRSHYTSKESKTQTLDLIESIGDGEPFCRSNAIKYLSRFGKKNGKSKMDILKAIHYCVLLYHFSGLHNETKSTYETF